MALCIGMRGAAGVADSACSGASVCYNMFYRLNRTVETNNP